MRINTLLDDKKTIVKALGEILELEPKYMGAPTFAYQVGNFTVDRYGVLETTDEDLGRQVTNELVERGIAVLEEKDEENELEIEVPTENHNGESLKNLVFMIHSKQCLLNKVVELENAFQIDMGLVAMLENEGSLTKDDFFRILKSNGGNEINNGVKFEEERIVFNGFTHTEDFKVTRAYAELSALIVKQAADQKRVSPKETIVENEKYAFRVWLIRLGFGGIAFKDSRKILLKNLVGHSAFRTEGEALKAKEKAKVKREASNQVNK